MLRAAVREAGGTLIESLVVEDDPQKTVTQMSRALANGSDFILCSGGVSVGRHDHIKMAAQEVGFSELFWKIRQKPGKPLYVAKKKSTLLFGLPGNPVSAFMCFKNFVLPVMESFQDRDPATNTIAAVSQKEFVNTGDRTDFIRITISRAPGEMPSFAPIANQGSHMLTSIVQADGYVPIPPGSVIKAGDLTEIFVF
jgi:molybdopterin molybdotransferase